MNPSEGGYVTIAKKVKDEPIRNSKITFDSIINMHYSEFNSGHDDFRPHDIIDEDDVL